MASIECSLVNKTYADGTHAVRDIDLSIPDGSLTVLVGPSGCGKTTLLRMIAGLEAITGGTIRIGPRVVNNVSAKDRDIAMVFQNYALYPYMTAFKNMAFGLKLRGAKKAEINRRVTDAAAALDLTEYLHKKPAQLSGGQRQRVAMGRAIVREPQVFLMDEPLSNLDAKLRVQMRAEIARIQKELGTTTIYVTHDQTEAMTLGDQVAVMRQGVIQQVATPQALFDHPRNLFVAGFIGSPPMNLVEATLRAAGDGRLVVGFGDTVLDIPQTLVQAQPQLRAAVGRRVVLGIRPEDMQDAGLATSAPAGTRLRARVVIRENLGREACLHVTLAASPVVTELTEELRAEVGGALLEAQGSGRAAHFVARVDGRSAAHADDTVELAVDTDALQFFDCESGESLLVAGPERVAEAVTA